MKNFIFILISVAFVFVCFAQQVSRTPYIQSGTPSSVIIKWRTDIAAKGKINYGTDFNNLSLAKEETSAVTEHELLIDNLQANTAYYYDIGTTAGVLIQKATSQYFKTSPAPGTIQPIKIWAMGDFGNGSRAQVAVMESYLNFKGQAHTDVWLWMGDNAYGSGTDQEYQTKVFEVYPDVFKNTVVWPSPGNHDYGSVDISNNGPYYSIFALPKNGEAGGEPSGEEGYYSFDYGNAHFISLNSEYLLWTLFPSTAMTDWLEEDLQQNTKTWVIAYWHQPPYTKGSHDSDEAFGRMGMMRSNINPILEEYGVDLVLCGHSHCYERSYLIQGHYGAASSFNASMVVDSTSPFTKYIDGTEKNKGTIYAVVGTAGQLSASGNLNHPAMAVSTYDYHGSLVVDINGDIIEAKFIDTLGNVRDSFSIEKTSSISTAVADEKLSNSLIRIYPNPAAGIFHVEFTAQSLSKTVLEVLDVDGKSVAVLFEGVPASKENIMTYSEHLPAGTYFIRMKSGKETLVKKIVLLD